MLKNYYYTEKEIDRLCKSIVILVDRREQKNQHITDWFTKKRIPWKEKSLDQGDYSFYIPANDELSIDRDLFFDKEIMVERKQHLDEIAGNFTVNRNRFEEEFSLFPGKKKYILLENSTYGDIVDKNYFSKLNVKSFLGSIHSFGHKYDAEVVYMPNNEYSGAWIYGTFLYYLKNLLR